MVTIASVSDIHGQWARKDLVYPPADVLVFAGDILKNYSYDRDEDATKQLVELQKFAEFLGTFPYEEIIVVAGNHDFVFERKHTKQAARTILKRGAREAIHYLEDQAVKLFDLVWYGSPWQPFFYDWAYNFPETDTDRRVARSYWAKIPDNTNVLITHGPPYKILDQCMDGREVGCPELRKKTDFLVANGSLKLHIFGHIHVSAGVKVIDQTVFKNTAILGEDYMSYRPITVEEI